MKKRLVLIAVTLGTPALATEPALIRVIGIGTASHAPEMAKVTFTAAGEGHDAEAAVRALATVQVKLVSTLDAQAGGSRTITGDVKVKGLRSKGCPDITESNEAVSSAMIDTQGATNAGSATETCAIIGYAASVDYTVTFAPADRAGTLIGSLARIGVLNPQTNEFLLSTKSAEAADRQATDQAISAATAEATALAAASHRRLGPIARIEDPAVSLVDNSGEAAVLRSPPPPEKLPPPIEILLKPAPIETTRRWIVSFELLP